VDEEAIARAGLQSQKKIVSIRLEKNYFIPTDTSSKIVAKVKKGYFSDMC
jgi:hypothetical protein